MQYMPDLSEPRNRSVIHNFCCDNAIAYALLLMVRIGPLLVCIKIMVLLSFEACEARCW